MGKLFFKQNKNTQMLNLSEKIADSYRKGIPAKANPGNPVTSRRRKLFSTIKERTGGDPEAELDYSLRIIQKERPKIESYILSKNEVPQDNIADLVTQAYQLRCKEINDTQATLGVSEAEAGIFLEDDEAETAQANSPEQDNFIGELFAPIGIAAKHIHVKKHVQRGNGADQFVDASLVTGLLNTAGGILDKGALKRAAQNKPSGIVGLLTGGKKEYELLRTYLNDPKNADEKDQVLKGVITDVHELRGYAGSSSTGGGLANVGYGVKVAGTDVLKAIEDAKKKEAIKKALPLIIIGVIALIVVTVLIVKHANRK
jgi:hypothetical protein